MPGSFVQTQVLWSTATSVTVNTAARWDSDVVTLNAETYDAALTVIVDNQGTPASGDVLDVYLRYTTGDVITGGGDDYDTTEHCTFLGRLDTYSTNTPGEDPAQRTFVIPTAPQKFKVSVESPNAATRNMLVKARLEEHRVA